MKEVKVGDKLVWRNKKGNRHTPTHVAEAELVTVERMYADGGVKTERGRFQTGGYNKQAYVGEHGTQGHGKVAGEVYVWDGETEESLAAEVAEGLAIKQAAEEAKATEQAERDARLNVRREEALKANAGRLIPQELVDGLQTVKLVDERGWETRFIFAVKTSKESDWTTRETYTRYELDLVGFRTDGFGVGLSGFDMSSVHGRSLQDAVENLVDANW